MPIIFTVLHYQKIYACIVSNISTRSSDNPLQLNYLIARYVEFHGMNESFNGKIRDEHLGMQWYRIKAKILIEGFRRGYNGYEAKTYHEVAKNLSEALGQPFSYEPRPPAPNPPT